jgi:prepilin peptidase CpaA
MPYPSIATVLLAVLVAVAAAFLDGRTGAVPNWLTLPTLAVAPLLHAWAGRGLRPPVAMPGALFAALVSIFAAVLCGLVPFFLFQFRLAGGGDAKLLAAIGALLLPNTGLFVELLAFAFAAFFVPARLAYHGRLLSTLGKTFVTAASPALPLARRRPLPWEMAERLRLGPFVLLGTLTAPFFLRHLS